MLKCLITDLPRSGLPWLLASIIGIVLWFSYDVIVTAQASSPGNFPLYVANCDNDRIAEIDSSGAQSQFFYNPSYSNCPTGLTFDTNNNLYVSSYNSNNITRITSSGTPTVFTSGGSLLRPYGSAFDSTGLLYVASRDNNTIVRINPAGTQSVFSSGGLINRPYDVAFDSNGILYVASCNNDRIVRITPLGTQSQFFYNPSFVDCPTGLTFDSSGNLYVSSNLNHRIVRITSSGTPSTITSGGNIRYPYGLEFNNGGDLFVASYDINRIVRITPSGSQSTFASGGLISRPFDVAFTPEEATAIDLVSFTVTPGASGVTLAWETATEVDNAGYNLHRATAPEGPYTKINDTLIPAKGSPINGATYSYPDFDANDPEVIYYYKLEDIDVNTGSTFHGPVSTAPALDGSSNTIIYLPLIVK